MAQHTNTRAHRDNSQDDSAHRHGRDLKPLPLGEGFLFVGGLMALGFVATLVVYGLQLAG